MAMLVITRWYLLRTFWKVEAACSEAAVHLTDLNLGPGRKDPRPQILVAHPTY